MRENDVLVDAINTFHKLRSLVKALPDSPEKTEIGKLVEQLGRRLSNIRIGRPEPPEPKDEEKN